MEGTSEKICETSDYKPRYLRCPSHKCPSEIHQSLLKLHALKFHRDYCHNAENGVQIIEPFHKEKDFQSVVHFLFHQNAVYSFQMICRTGHFHFILTNVMHGSQFFPASLMELRFTTKVGLELITLELELPIDMKTIRKTIPLSTFNACSTSNIIVVLLTVMNEKDDSSSVSSTERPGSRNSMIKTARTMMKMFSTDDRDVTNRQ